MLGHCLQKLAKAESGPKAAAQPVHGQGQQVLGSGRDTNTFISGKFKSYNNIRLSLTVTLYSVMTLTKSLLLKLAWVCRFDFLLLYCII